jgi:hypothetical protein
LKDLQCQLRIIDLRVSSEGGTTANRDSHSVRCGTTSQFPMMGCLWSYSILRISNGC